MLVILKGNTNYTFNHLLEGKKVVATECSMGGVEVKVAELNRVGAKLPLAFNEDLFSGWNASEALYFKKDSFEIVKPKLINCTNLNVGKGWHESSKGNV